MKKTICLITVLAVVMFSGCSKNTESKSEVASTPETTATVSEVNFSESLEFMKLAIGETSREKSIEYAEEACKRAGVKPRILTSQEISDLNKRNDEIDILTATLESNTDKASLERRAELLKESLCNTVLTMYNDIIANK